MEITLKELREAYEKAYGTTSGPAVLLGALSYHVPQNILKRMLKDTLQEIEKNQI